MKKLLGIIVLGLLFANIGFAEITELKSKSLNRYDLKNVKGEDSTGDNGITTVCIEGYLFVTYYDFSAVSIVQFYKERDGKSLPAKC